MILVISIMVTVSFAQKTALEIVDAHPVGNSIVFDQPLIELLSKPYNEEKINLLRKYGIAGKRQKGSENYFNTRNRYNTLVVRRDPQGNLLTIARTFPIKSGLKTELLNVPDRSTTLCAFDLNGKPTGCYTQSGYACEMMNLRNREDYILQQVSSAHRQGVQGVQSSLPGSYKNKSRKYSRAFSKIKNSLDPKNRDVMLQVCQTQIAHMDRVFTVAPERAVASVPDAAVAPAIPAVAPSDRPAPATK